MTSDPKLRRSYLKFNDVFFGGELPTDVPVFWEPASGNLGETFEVESLDDTGGQPELAIRIDPTLRFASVMWKQTLLHEMIHVKLYPYLGHGAKFDKELMRLCSFASYRKLL